MLKAAIATWAAIVLVNIAIVVGIVYVCVHFISKFW